MLPVHPSGCNFWGRGLRLLFVGLALASAVLRSAEPSERVTYLKEQITTLEGVVNATKTPAEKAKLDETLQRRRRELALIEERQDLEAREKELRSARPKGSMDLLREKLRDVHPVISE